MDWAKTTARRDETRNIYVLGLSASYIRELTVQSSSEIERREGSRGKMAYLRKKGSHIKNNLPGDYDIRQESCNNANT